MDKKNSVKAEMDKAKKQKRRGDGKKMVKQSLLILLLSVFALVTIGFIQGILNRFGITVSNVVIDGFSSILAIVVIFAIIGLYIGSVLWFDLKSYFNHKVGGGMSILDPRNPAGPNYINDRSSISNPQNAGNPNSLVYKLHHRS